MYQDEAEQIARNLQYVELAFYITVPTLIGLLIIRLGRIAEALEEIAANFRKGGGSETN